jgi:hypothetical protein
MYIYRYTAARSRNHCCKAKRNNAFCIVELHVTVNNLKILSTAQWTICVAGNHKAYLGLRSKVTDILRKSEVS